MPPDPAGGFPVGEPITIPLVAKPAPAIFLCDAIDPETGDYRSILTGVDPVEGAILEALRVRRRSGSAVGEEGQEFYKLEKIDDQFASALEADIRHALRRLVDNRWIDNLEIEIDTEDVSASVTVNFRNRARMADGKVTLPLLSLISRAA